MTTPHIKVSQEDAETLVIRMDRAGFEIFRRLIVRAQAIPEDDRQLPRRPSGRRGFSGETV